MQQLIDQIQTSFKQQFPKGYCNIYQTKGLAGDQISLTIGLVNDINHVSNKIRENDPMMHKFLIFINGDQLEANLLHGALSVNPLESWLAMSHIKTGFRKTTGNATKIAKAYDKFFTKLHATVTEQRENIYNLPLYQDYL